MGGTAGFDPNSSINKMLLGVMGAKKGLRYKGFLGPSINERRDLPSVGHRSAMSRGIIIDDNGKMRCPPGTPNANQFTDINMSNCMVPSAETLASGAAELAQTALRRTRDGFRRSSHRETHKDPEIIPDARIGFANEEGFLEQRRVLAGNQVVSPVDGSPRILNTVDDSILHIAEGGALTDIPDDHLVYGIVANVGQDKRFETIGFGDGINGMQRISDKHTGALIGVKYPRGNDTYKAGMPGEQSKGEEAINEAVAEVLAEMMGYEPMPMRLVPGMGFDGYNSGVALVTELAHNRYPGEIESMRISERPKRKPKLGGVFADGSGYGYDIDTKQIVRMRVMDAILQNADRHEGNGLIAGDGETRTLIPIDHSRSFSFRDLSTPENMESMMWFTDAMMHGFDPDMDQFITDKGFEKLIDIVAEVQEELRSLDPEKIEREIDSVLAHVRSFLSQPLTEGRRDTLMAMLPRIKALQGADPRTIAEQILPEYKRRHRQSIIKEQKKRSEARTLVMHPDIVGDVV